LEGSDSVQSQAGGGVKAGLYKKGMTQARKVGESTQTSKEDLEIRREGVRSLIRGGAVRKPRKEESV